MENLSHSIVRGIAITIVKNATVLRVQSQVPLTYVQVIPEDCLNIQ